MEYCVQAQLTQRENEVAILLLEGLSNKEIADRLVIELSTVEWHLRNMYPKFNARNRVVFVLNYMRNVNGRNIHRT